MYIHVYCNVVFVLVINVRFVFNHSQLVSVESRQSSCSKIWEGAISTRTQRAGGKENERENREGEKTDREQNEEKRMRERTERDKRPTESRMRKREWEKKTDREKRQLEKDRQRQRRERKRDLPYNYTESASSVQEFTRRWTHNFN